jgi:hypothetical protein
VTSQIAAIVKDASHLDYAIFAAAIKKKMPGLFHSEAVHSAPAEFKVIGPRALDHDVRTFLRIGPFGIISNVAALTPKEFHNVEPQLYQIPGGSVSGYRLSRGGLGR